MNRKRAESKYPGMTYAGTWLPDDLYKKVKEIASSDDRSIALWMRRLIEREVNGGIGAAKNGPTN